MRLNVEKFKVMHVRFKNPKTKYLMTDSTSGNQHELAETKLERDLGVYVSSDLNSHGQVNQAV